MKVRLEVLASVSIKRKKPWPRIVWLGKEKESLFLLDEKRLSVLYVPSGKTKRNVQKLSTLLGDCVCLTPSPDGLYLVGVQSSGEVFAWQKDKDELKTIVGLPNLLVEENISSGDGCKAFLSPDCSHLLLVFGNRHVFLWQKESYTEESKNNTLPGKWSRVTSSMNIPLPSSENKEATVHAVFAYREVFGHCCQLSIVFNRQADLCVSSLLIRFGAESAISSPQSAPASTSVWTFVSRPLKSIQPGLEPINLKGSYSCQYSHDGHIVAVGVNQKSPKHTSILYLAAFTETVLVSDLKGCGLKDPGNKRGRQYWISNLAWTCDNLFLAVILHNGFAGLLSRLGEPVAIFSKGCSVELGPAYFLPFTPVISVQSDRKSASGGDDQSQSTESDLDHLRQKFSVSSHPTLPVLLYSDGYIVTIIQLPSEFSPVIFMRDLILESSSHLGQLAETHRLDLTLANAYNLPAGEIENIRTAGHRFIHSKPHKKDVSHYSFEEPSMSLNETLGSEVSFALGAVESAKTHSGAVHNMNSGRIIFGEPDVLQETGSSFINEPSSTMKTLQLARINLFNVWKLAASTTELWSANMDKILNHTVHNIVKLFSLVLDCPQIRDLLVEAGDQFANSPAIHTASLFRVVSMYRQLLDLLQFDYHQHHLLAPVLQLSHKTLHTILSSVGLSQSDPRLKTLTGCYTLLKFTEKNLQQTYVTMPKALQSIAGTSKAWLGKNEIDLDSGTKGSFQKDMQLGKRLTATWKLLYKSVTEFVASTEASAAEIRQAQSLQSLIQQCLLELDADIPKAPSPNLNIGERLSLDGKHTLAINAWKDQLKQFKEVGSVKNAGRLFHSLLYTYILRNDLVTAISFVDNLIVTANPELEYEFDPDQKMSRDNLQPSLLRFVTSSLRERALYEPDMMPCIRDKAVRSVVQSMARFMAAYFGNQAIFIYPPHNPAPLPAIHFEPTVSNSHIIPKYHEDVAAIIRFQKLDSIWTVERTLEYLMLSGLVCEATWFSHQMGDWKAAYQLSVAHLLHKHVVPSVYERPKKPLTLPEWLTPDAIMKEKLEQLVKDDLKLTHETSDLTCLTKILEDIALSGLLGFVEVGSWLLEELVVKLKLVVKQLNPLVTKDFYLPSPPLYLPQPARMEERHLSLEAEEEIKLREKASVIIQLALCVLNACHFSIESVRWYVYALNEAQKKASQFKVNIEGPCTDLPDVLYQYMEEESVFPHPADDQSVASVQSSFRDLCSILWLLHARDKLSLALRTREKFLNFHSSDVDSSEQWLRENFSTLQWAAHMLAFSRFLPDEASIYKVILSLLLDFPSNEDVANILAECMYDLENLHPEVQERLERTLNSWQGVILVPEAYKKPEGDMGEELHRSVTFVNSSPRGKSLSVYFHKQCMVMDKVLKRKNQCFGTYEEFVFTDVKDGSTESDFKLNVGSRPFETKKSYLEFLDTFVSVSFSRVLEIMAAKNKISSLPLLRVFSKDIIDKEMVYFTEKVSSSAHQRPQGLSVLSGASQALARASSHERLFSLRRKSQEKSLSGRGSSLERNKTLDGRAHQLKSNKPVGLFRGMSMLDAPLKRSYSNVRRYESEPFLDELESLDGSEAQTTPSRKRGKSQQNLASRFMLSEENIYQSSAMRDQGKHMWSLTVSFGKKYAALQHIVEWLEVWGGKSHSLGVPNKEEILDIAPKMKIHIPAQLIILALWLLEYKYGPNVIELPKSQKLSQSKRSRRLSRSPFRSQSLSPPNSGHNTARTSQTSTSPVIAESVQFSQEKIKKVSNQKKDKDKMRPRIPSGEDNRVTNDQSLKQSLQYASLEQDQIISAYTQLLDDDPEGNSSSFDVSSLASHELDNDLKATLNVIRRTGTSSSVKENTTLNQTILPKDESPERHSPAVLQPKDSSTPIKKEDLITAEHRMPSQSQHITSSHNRHSQTDLKNTNQNKSVSPPCDLRSQDRSHDVENDIANQLQGVIRSELRRIMEVQHRNVLAMMGALDGDSHADFAHATSHSTLSSTQSLPHRQKVGSPRRSKKHSQSQTTPKQHNQHQVPEKGYNVENSTIPTQEDIVSHSLSRTQAVRRQARMSGHVKEALAELQNLQHETNQNLSQRSIHQAVSYSEGHNTQAQNLNSGHPQPPSGSNQLLPFLPIQAWNEQKYQHPGLFQGFGVPKMPLLHINKVEHQEDPFRNLRHYLSILPHPQPHTSQQYFHPPAPAQPLFSFFTPAAHPQRQPPPPYEQPLPLLSVSSDERGSLGFPLLRMLAPGSAPQSSEAAGKIIRQREKVEEMRQKMLRKFQEQVLADKENTEKEEFAHKMLHIETPEKLESARSVKSKTSDTDPSVRPDSEQERASPVQEQLRTEVADASTSDTRINSGFALPRGIFDSYLQLGEQLIGPEVNETNAAFQLRMALAMQRQAENRIRAKVDFSTMTQEQVDAIMATDPAMESVRTAEAATSITKDAAVDPVQEVINEYNLKRHNNLIPPDIFMGLRFADQDSQSGVEPGAPSSIPNRGRSYLNVVDIRASSVLRDIPGHEERAEPLQDQDKLETAILTSARTAEQIGALEETLRQKFTQRADRPSGHDAVTVKLFDDIRVSKEKYLSVAVMPRSSISEPKAAMMRRLRDMSDQMKVMDEISQNIEREFKSSHLLLQTIQDINDSVQRSRSPYAKSKDQESKQMRYSMETEEEKLSRGSSPEAPAIKTSVRSPQISARSKNSLESRSDERLVKMTGGLDELISEVIEQEGSDQETTEKMIKQLNKDAREQIQRSGKIKRTTQMDKLISARQADEHVKSRTPYERQQLKAWMTEKFHQRQEEYRRRRNELIGREPKPFRSQTTVTKLDLKSLEEKSEKRMNMVSEFMNQRLIDAENLLGSIIVDKPEIPWSSLSAGDTKQRNQSRSPKRSGSSISPQRPGASRKSRSPGRSKVSTATWTYKAESASRSPYGKDFSKISRDASPMKGILKTRSADMYQDHQLLTSISEGNGTLDSSTDIINYARQVLKMEGSGEFSPEASYERESKAILKDASVREDATQATTKAQAAKGKSYMDIVKMQRPEATRKWKEVNRQRQLQEENERLVARQEVLAKEAASQDPNLLKDRAKEYGSKNIPGFSPRQVVPRRVKTYTERLQEMKPCSTKPFSQRSASARTVSSRTFHSSMPLDPPHKPQTYVEQLQNLSSKVVSTQRSIQTAQSHRRIPVRMRTFLKSHGPKHKPKTYAEQLQELNPHPHKEAHGRGILQSTVTLQSSKLKTHVRTRPYGDPYSQVDYEELASVLSDWDVDENIHNILYGGSSPTTSAAFLANDVEMSASEVDFRHIAPSEGQSDYYDAVMQGGLPYRTEAGTEIGMDDYRSSVDIQDIERIAELASVGSGSVLSVIDWEAVEDLIKDV